MFEDLENVSQNLKPSRISQNSRHLAKITEMIKITMTPKNNLFLCDIKKCCLFDTTSRRSKNDEVASFLLNVESIVREAHEKSIEEWCIEDMTSLKTL